MSARVLRNLMSTSLVTAFLIPLPIFWHQRQATALATGTSTCAAPAPSATPSATIDPPARPAVITVSVRER